MNDIVTEATLPESFLFDKFNSTSSVREKIIQVKRDGTLITPDYVEEQILQIKRTHVSVLVDSVLDAFTNGRIQILYSTRINIPTALPFLITKEAGKTVGWIFPSPYGTVSENSDGKPFFNITMKDLYSLLEATFIGMQYADNPNSLQNKMGPMKTSMYIYVSIITNILNKEYALSMDFSTYEKVCFCLGKFFLERIWMYKNADVIFSYASHANPFPTRGRNIYEFTVLNDEYDKADIKNINDLITFLSGISPRLKTLNTRYFLDAFIRMYKPAATFGLEVLPYFLFIITSSLIGSFIVRSDVVGDMTKRIPAMNRYYPELVRALNF